MSNTVSLFKSAENFETFAAGATIFTEGEVGETMYVVQEGEVDVVAGGVTLETVTAGGIFGEMALLERGPRSATVIARTECRVVPVNERHFRYLVEQTPNFALEVMRIMSARLRRKNVSAK